MQDRFSRIEMLLGEKTVEKFAGSFVVVVGAGAVGSYCIEALARSGVGKIRIVDFDRVSVTNINRQLFALDSTVGRLKVDVAKERIHDINPEAVVETMNVFANTENFPQILDGNPDLLVDCIDSLNPKCNLLQYAYENGIKTVSSMGAALRRDPLQVRTADLMDTKGCPLAKHVRVNLRRRGVRKGIMCVYSAEPVDFSYKEDAEPEFDEQILDHGRKRHTLGSLPAVTGIFGLTLASLALNVLSDSSESQRLYPDCHPQCKSAEEP